MEAIDGFPVDALHGELAAAGVDAEEGRAAARETVRPRGHSPKAEWVDCRVLDLRKGLRLRSPIPPALGAAPTCAIGLSMQSWFPRMTHHGTESAPAWGATKTSAQRCLNAGSLRTAEGA